MPVSRLVCALAVLLMLPLAAHAQLRPGKPTVLITGASRGMGLELVRQYAERGWNVIATARHPHDGARIAAVRAIQAKYPNVAYARIDVTDTAQIRAVAAQYRDQPIDVLINNAAAVSASFAKDMKRALTPFEQIDFDRARNDFDVNALGPMRMAQAFLPNIERSKRKEIISITSNAGSFANPLPRGIAMNYGASKAALNKYMVMLAIKLKPAGVRVGLVEPIFVATKVDQKHMRGAAPVGQAVAKLIHFIDTMPMSRSGRITNFQTGKIDPF